MLRKALLAVSLVLGFQSICSSFAADVQQARKVWRIGVIANSVRNTPDTERIWGAFRQELQKRGIQTG